MIIIIIIGTCYSTDCESCELDLSESLDVPPDYAPAKNYPVSVRILLSRSA